MYILCFYNNMIKLSFYNFTNLNMVKCMMISTIYNIYSLFGFVIRFRVWNSNIQVRPDKDFGSSFRSKPDPLVKNRIRLLGFRVPFTVPRLGPVDRSVDLQRVLLSSWEKRLTDRSAAIPIGQKSDRCRSINRRISLWFFPKGYILFCLFLDLFSMTLFGFLLIFSSPINSGTVEKTKKKIQEV